jgi:poly-gamma-glutamate capsule biosynthesis protein CapA/YwtB (metallophosphatase superfamily)
VKRLPLYVVLGLLLVAVAVPMSGGELGFGGEPAASARSSASARPSVALGAVGSLPAGSATPSVPAPSPTAAPSAPSVSTAVADVLVVPVTQFRSTRTLTTRAEVAQVLAGTSTRYDALELVAGDADAILRAVGAQRPSDPARLKLAKDARTLTRDLAKARKRLAFLRADQVDPSVRALAWGKASLFGVGRVRTAARWPLKARLPVAKGTTAFDPATTWTLFSGGDIMLDRGVAQTLKIRGKGVDFPFSGGTAAITSRYCCSSFGWRLPRTQRTGGAGAMRQLVHGADLAIANFENPAPDKFRYHTSGTLFSADPKLIKGLATAGIDWVGLANNHIRDAGGAGLLQTIKNLSRYGIRSSGAGKNIAAARKPAILKAGGVKVALLAYDTIAAYYTAGATTPGSARLTAKAVKADVKAARAAGANVVIVFPHWGTEYDATPFPGQQALARAAVNAGADLVIGNHAHWAGALEVYRGKPIWYALGNFVFDQTWSELTMEGITLELTFRGKALVQARMRPHIILDKAQPNLLDPAVDGRVVMGQIFDASKGLLPW